MGQGATEVDDRLCRINWDAREERDVFATMRIGGDVRDRRMS